jgi:hypothetical protein
MRERQEGHRISEFDLGFWPLRKLAARLKSEHNSIIRADAYFEVLSMSEQYLLASGARQSLRETYN